jgi:L-amino acid N-acyltransferase YncA
MTELRPAEPGDGRAIAEVHRTTWAATYTQWIPDIVDRYNLEERAADFSRAATSDRAHLMVAVDDGVVVGFAASGPATGDDGDDGTGAVYMIYIDPQLHGQGIGQALMADALGWLAGNGYGECILWVAEQSTRSRRFYEEVGFTLDEGAADEWLGLATVRYRRPLTHP